MLVDAVAGVTRQDAHVAGYAWEAGRATALVINKWDLVEDRAEARDRVTDQIDQQLAFLRHAPVAFLSALTGKGVHRLFPLMQSLHEAYVRRVPTADLNRVLKEAWQAHPPSAGGRREPRLFYCTQVGVAPPRFVAFTNLTGQPHFSYLRHLENALRSAFGFEGVPIRVMIKGRPH